MTNRSSAVWMSVSVAALVVIFVSFSGFDWSHGGMSETMHGSASKMDFQVLPYSSLLGNENASAALVAGNGTSGDIFTSRQVALKEGRLLAAYQRADLFFDPNGAYGLFGAGWNMERSLRCQ
jgi:hypothetical protein